MGSVFNSPWLPHNGILYVLFCIIFVCEPTELRGFGLTVEGLFGSWLGDPSRGFLQYHIKRFYAALALHAFLPILYGCYLQDHLAISYWSIASVPFILTLSVLALYYYEALLHPIEQQVHTGLKIML